MTELCTLSHPSLLRQKEKNQLTSLNWNAINTELKDRCPSFHKFLSASVSNPSQTRNKHKKGEAILPAMLDAGCQLISVFNADLDATRRVKSIILKKGGLKKVGFKRMSSLNSCLSYDATATMMEGLGDGYDRKLLEWKEEIEKGVKDENELLACVEAAPDNDQNLIAQCQSALVTHRDTMHPGYSFTGDNVDINCKPRQMTMKNRNKDHHMFQIVAFKNRKSSNHLPSNVHNGDVNTIPFTTFLPSPEDQSKLKDELVIIVGHKWAQYIPALSWLKEYLPPNITHEYIDKTHQKTEKVSFIHIYNIIVLMPN